MSFCFIWITMLWIYGNYNYFKNKTSVIQLSKPGAFHSLRAVLWMNGAVILPVTWYRLAGWRLSRKSKKWCLKVQEQLDIDIKPVITPNKWILFCVALGNVPSEENREAGLCPTLLECYSKVLLFMHAKNCYANILCRVKLEGSICLLSQ